MCVHGTHPDNTGAFSHLWGEGGGGRAIILPTTLSVLVASPFPNTGGCGVVFCKARKKLAWLSFFFLCLLISSCHVECLSCKLTERVIKAENARVIKTRLLNCSVQSFIFSFSLDTDKNISLKETKLWTVLCFNMYNCQNAYQQVVFRIKIWT